MERSKGQNYIYGAAILTAGVIVMKILGAIYKVPIQHIIGDDGFSMFLATYNVYNVFLSLATAGLPVALSRMISEANAQGRPMQARRIFSVAWRAFFAIGLVCTLIMFFFPEQLANGILNNPDAARSIRAMSPAVLLVCLVSAYRGYCQGHGNMIPTTIGQVLEVLVKVIVGLLLAGLIMKAGMGKPLASAGAIFGVTAGSLAVLIYMVVYTKRNYAPEAVANPDTPDSRGSILKQFLRIGIPITLGASILSLLNLIDSGLCMNRLQSAAGFSLKEAQVLYGAYGTAQTLFNLPAAFATPLTISIVPAIAAAIVKKQHDEATKMTEDSLRITTVLCLPMSLGLSVLSYPIMRVIYPDGHASGPALLAIMGIACFFVCITLMGNAILQATGNERCTVYSMLAGGVVKIVTNWVLVARPEINIYGAAIGTLLSYLVMCIMSYIFMLRSFERAPSLKNIGLRAVISSALMAATAWAVYGLAEKFIGADGRFGMVICMGLAIIAAVIVYLVVIIVLGAIKSEDMKLIPGGAKIARILHLK